MLWRSTNTMTSLFHKSNFVLCLQPMIDTSRYSWFCSMLSWWSSGSCAWSTENEKRDYLETSMNDQHLEFYVRLRYPKLMILTSNKTIRQRIIRNSCIDSKLSLNREKSNDLHFLLLSHLQENVLKFSYGDYGEGVGRLTKFTSHIAIN